MGRKRLYTDEERKQRHKKCVNKYQQEHKDEIAEYQAEYYAKWYQENKEKKLEQNDKWRAEHPERYREYQAKYHKTPMGRAKNLVGGYQTADKKYNRGKCTLTSKWVVDNIFSKPCHYCGAIGWDIIGCDRIDNSLPHTPDNVVPCCFECNRKRGAKSYEEFISQ